MKRECTDLVFGIHNVNVLLAIACIISPCSCTDLLQAARQLVAMETTVQLFILVVVHLWQIHQ